MEVVDRVKMNGFQTTALTTQTVQELGKSQAVRQLDFLALGPFLVWAGMQTTLPPWAKTLLVISGIGTIVFNLQNFRANQ